VNKSGLGFSSRANERLKDRKREDKGGGGLEKNKREINGKNTEQRHTLRF